MTIIVGLIPGERGRPALDLATMLARSLDETLVVTTVVPTPWPPSQDRVDAEYIELLGTTAEQSFEAARARIPTDVTVKFEVEHARSVASGILDAASRHDAKLVVVGSSSAAVRGRIALGSVTDRVLHSLQVPVALAPVGFTAGPADKISRVTVAFGRADRNSDLLRTAGSTATEIGVSVRVACFAVRPMLSLVGSIEDRADELVVDAWIKKVDNDLARSLAPPHTVRGLTDAPLKTVVGQGTTWHEALADVPWTHGDLLAVGTSSSSLSRFFLGSHASKIVRHSSVPVVLIPRSGTRNPSIG